MTKALPPGSIDCGSPTTVPSPLMNSAASHRPLTFTDRSSALGSVRMGGLQSGVWFHRALVGFKQREAVGPAGGRFLTDW
jgi:hypothetical protein